MFFCLIPSFNSGNKRTINRPKNNSCTSNGIYILYRRRNYQKPNTPMNTRVKVGLFLARYIKFLRKCFNTWKDKTFCSVIDLFFSSNVPSWLLLRDSPFSQWPQFRRWQTRETWLLQMIWRAAWNTSTEMIRYTKSQNWRSVLAYNELHRGFVPFEDSIISCINCWLDGRLPSVLLEDRTFFPFFKCCSFFGLKKKKSGILP